MKRNSKECLKLPEIEYKIRKFKEEMDSKKIIYSLPSDALFLESLQNHYDLKDKF